MIKMEKRRLTVRMLILCLLALITILPFYLMLIMGTHSSFELFQGITVLPGDDLLKNLQTIVQSSFGMFYKNSIIASAVATLFGVLTSAMAGYALSKYHFKRRELIFNLIVATMMIPPQISLVAYVIEMRSMHLMNSLWPVIVPYSYSAFGVFWMRQSIQEAVPDDVIESARIDGASEIRIFISIVMPFVKSALITISLLIFLWSWNSYLLPMITINDMESYTVPLGIAMLNGMYKTDYAAKILALSFGTIPLVIMFGFGSKYFVRGLTAGAVKG